MVKKAKTKDASVLLAEAWGAFAKSWDEYLKLFLLKAIPLFYLLIAAALALWAYAPGSPVATDPGAQLVMGFLIMLGLVALAVIVTYELVFYVLFAKKPTDAIETIRRTVSIFWPALLVLVLWFFIMSIGHVVLVVPGIILSIYLLFPLFVLVHEDKRGMDAIRRSIELVTGFWWATAYKIVVFCIIVLIIMWLGLLVFGISALFGWLTIIVFGFILTAWGVLYLNGIYLDLRRITDRNRNATEDVAFWKKFLVVGYFVFKAMVGLLLLMGCILAA